MGRSVLKKKFYKNEELNVLRSTWPQKTAIGVAKNTLRATEDPGAHPPNLLPPAISMER